MTISERNDAIVQVWRSDTTLKLRELADMFGITRQCCFQILHQTGPHPPRTWSRVGRLRAFDAHERDRIERSCSSLREIAAVVGATVSAVSAAGWVARGGGVGSATADPAGALAELVRRFTEYLASNPEEVSVGGYLAWGRLTGQETRSFASINAVMRTFEGLTLRSLTEQCGGDPNLVISRSPKSRRSDCVARDVATQHVVRFLEAMDADKEKPTIERWNGWCRPNDAPCNATIRRAFGGQAWKAIIADARQSMTERDTSNLEFFRRIGREQLARLVS